MAFSLQMHETDDAVEEVEEEEEEEEEGGGFKTHCECGASERSAGQNVVYYMMFFKNII